MASDRLKIWPTSGVGGSRLTLRRSGTRGRLGGSVGAPASAWGGLGLGLGCAWAASGEGCADGEVVMAAAAREGGAGATGGRAADEQPVMPSTTTSRPAWRLVRTRGKLSSHHEPLGVVPDGWHPHTRAGDQRHGAPAARLE